MICCSRYTHASDENKLKDITTGDGGVVCKIEYSNSNYGHFL